MVQSALINEAPNTEDDYWVVRAILLSAGLSTSNADNGVHVKPTRPDPYHFETKGPGIIAGLCVCIVIIALVTGLRLYLRYAIRRLKWGMDDTIMIPGLITAVAYPAIQIAMVKYGGAGRHIYDVTYHEYYIYHWLAAVAQIDFYICVGIVKMSITIFNMRLTDMGSIAWITSNWIFFSIVLCYIIIAFFLNVFQCVPARTSFDYIAYGKLSEAPKCLGISRMGTILRAINITMDYCLLAVPLIALWKLQMSWRQKARLFSLFSVGALACIGSVLTLIAKSHLKSDALWNYTGILGWSLVELVFSVLAASLPTLACLLPASVRTAASDSDRTPPRQNAFGASPKSEPQFLSCDASVGGYSDVMSIIHSDEIELRPSTPSEPDSCEHVHV